MLACARYCTYNPRPMHTGTTINSPKTAHAGGFHMQGHPVAAWGLSLPQEPPKRRALASEDSRSYAPGRLGPMRKTRKQDSKKIKKIATGPVQAC